MFRLLSLGLCVRAQGFGPELAIPSWPTFPHSLAEIDLRPFAPQAAPRSPGRSTSDHRVLPSGLVNQ